VVRFAAGVAVLEHERALAEVRGPARSRRLERNEAAAKHAETVFREEEERSEGEGGGRERERDNGAHTRTQGMTAQKNREDKNAKE
jgi:hypothetical protein